jgi:hypothetical protein
LTLFVLTTSALVAGHVALRVAEPRLVSWGRDRALTGVRSRDYPASFYVAGFDAAWQQTLRATNPLRPGSAIPLIALGGTLWWWSRPASSRVRAQPLVLVALTALPLLGYGQVRLPAIPASVAREEPELLRALNAPSGSSETLAPRVLTWLPLATDFEVRQGIEAAGRDADVASYRLLKHLLTPNWGIALGVPQLDGYENLMTQRQAILLAALGSERAPGGGELAVSPLGLRDRRLRFGDRWPLVIASGVGTVLSTERMQPLQWPSTIRFEPRLLTGGGDLPPVDAYAVGHPLPRAYVTTDWAAVDTPEAAARALLASGAPLATTVEIPSGGKAALPRPRAAQEGLYEARILAYGERRVEIESEADADAFLVLLDANAPGWSATVTVQPVPIYNANVAFRAVPIPAGRHRVVFTYVPPHWSPAQAITVAASSLVGAWFTIGGIRWRRAQMAGVDTAGR